MSRVAVRRPLTDAERDLLKYLAVQTVADQVPCPWQDAVDALNELSGRGLVELVGDALDVCLTVGGHVLVHAEREWLAFQVLADEAADPPPVVGTPLPLDPSPQPEA